MAEVGYKWCVTQPKITEKCNNKLCASPDKQARITGVNGVIANSIYNVPTLIALKGRSDPKYGVKAKRDPKNVR